MKGRYWGILLGNVLIFRTKCEVGAPLENIPRGSNTKPSVGGSEKSSLFCQNAQFNAVPDHS